MGGGAVVPVVVAVGLGYVSVSVEPTGALGAALEAAELEKEGLLAEVGGATARVGDASRELALLRRVTDTPKWRGLMLAVTERVSGRASLSRLALGGAEREDGTRTLQLAGETRSTQTLSELLLDLEELPIFWSVDLMSSNAVRDRAIRFGDGEEAERAAGPGRIEFRLMCVVGEPVVAPAEAEGDDAEGEGG